MAVISITASEGLHAARGLGQVLANLESCSLGFTWYLLEFEAGFFSKVGGSDDHTQDWIRDLCIEIERRRAGVPLPWERVKTLSECMHPSDMVLLIAAKPDVPPPTWPLNVASPLFEIAIQGTDDCCWNVTTRNGSVIKRLQERFHNLQFIC